MSKNKARVREKFRDDTFARDGHTCVIPGCSWQRDLDAHHITPREQMPNGGYVKENGASLCPTHHVYAEDVLQTLGVPADKKHEGFDPETLYRLIGSSREKAVVASERL